MADKQEKVHVDTASFNPLMWVLAWVVVVLFLQATAPKGCLAGGGLSVTVDGLKHTLVIE